jgi:NAD(P)-dependent dehydrogenase (short-subunit alcohol dehydrogenase family)
MSKRKHVLVTGASRGLGRSIALELARRDFSVFAGVRQLRDGISLSDESPGNLRLLQLDVTSATSIADAGVIIRDETDGDGLAGLVNNAGVLLLGPFEQTPLDAIEELFRVNVLGPIAVIQCLLPLLRATPGRIVNISSVNGKLSTPFSSFYSASKFALEALSDSLRVELNPWGIEVAVVEPGVTQSGIRAQSVNAWTERRAALDHAARSLYEVPYRALRDQIELYDASAANHYFVVDAVYHALTAKFPHTRYACGPDAARLLAFASLSDRERDREFRSCSHTEPFRDKV